MQQGDVFFAKAKRASMHTHCGSRMYSNVLSRQIYNSVSPGAEYIQKPMIAPIDASRLGHERHEWVDSTKKHLLELPSGPRAL